MTLEATVAKAVQAFEAAVGRQPTNKEFKRMCNKVAWALDNKPLPAQEFPRVGGFKMGSGRTLREAEWWRDSCFKSHEKLLHIETPNHEYIRGAHTFHIDNDPKVDYSDDTEIIAVWNGKEFLDPTDGVPVVFGRSQWAG